MWEHLLPMCSGPRTPASATSSRQLVLPSADLVATADKGDRKTRRSHLFALWEANSWNTGSVAAAILRRGTERAGLRSTRSEVVHEKHQQVEPPPAVHPQRAPFELPKHLRCSGVPLNEEDEPASLRIDEKRSIDNGELVADPALGLDIAETSRNKVFQCCIPGEAVRPSHAANFRSACLHKYGSACRAWRRLLDPGGVGRVSFGTFCDAARSLGYSDVRSLWNALDPTQSGFISLDKWDPEIYATLSSFRALCYSEFGGMDSAFRWGLDRGGSTRVSRNDLASFCREHDLNVSSEHLFQALDESRRGYIVLDDLDFLVRWQGVRFPLHDKASFGCSFPSAVGGVSGGCRQERKPTGAVVGVASVRATSQQSRRRTNQSSTASAESSCRSSHRTLPPLEVIPGLGVLPTEESGNDWMRTMIWRRSRGPAS
eukprot:TRINITY_DN27204_c0_g1_i1.p1 TRINITY_DN27204_c0_g1~~TRINITY_DN27204_c0_g1_i1.p1  ORF type:complete len:430 (-),score=57.04 TRINITY_DN27204_c0_g1_i1:227-1516(-)